MVRFLSVQHRDRAGLRQAVLPGIGSAGRNVAGLRHLCRRLCRPPDRRRDLRPLRRPHRAQGGADRDPAVDGHRDLSRRVRADLCADRHLGCDHPDHPALYPGRRGRRRVGRLGAAVDGVGAIRPSSRLYRRLAAIRRAGRAVPREFGGAGIQPDRRQPVPRLGMAHSVLPQHHPGRDRPLYPARHSRDADLCAIWSRRTGSRRRRPSR